ncbi:MAG: amidase [Pseudomonadota bacterium]|nr:amidase [Pseudomonadota bacterium]
MDKTDLAYTPASELVELIATKALSPVEVMETTLARLDDLNPTLNAVCTPTPELAMDAARKAEQAVVDGDTLGPLHGVPTSIKDLAPTKGIRTMHGSHVYADFVPDEDAPFVGRLAAAGAISLGKTTTPEFGWMGCGKSPLTGVSHNPWKHGYNAGGSSTGAAICAAAGIGPIHQGSDGAGSIRMPSAFCGIYGIKPSYGRVPYGRHTTNNHSSHIGPMTRTVTDAAMMLHVMSGPDDRDQTSLEAPPADYVGRLDEGTKGLRVAFSSDLGYLPVDSEIAEAVANAAKAFEAAGVVVEEVDPGWGDHHEMERIIWSVSTATNLAPLLDQWEDKMDAGMVACAREGMRYSGVEYSQAQTERHALYAKVQKFFEHYDLLLTPSLSVAAFPADLIIPEHWEQHDWDWIRWAGFSYPFNLTWSPAATCPCGFTSDGLPIGLQIVGGRFHDLRVLQASWAFEQIMPWADKRPPLE